MYILSTLKNIGIRSFSRFLKTSINSKNRSITTPYICDMRLVLLIFIITLFVIIGQVITVERRRVLIVQLQS